MKLFFRKLGEGKPLIILHGLLGMSDNWVTFGKKLSENGFCVFIPDLRNHGNSPHTEEFNFTVLAEDISDFIHEQSLNDPAIIGHSLGGKIALNFALNYPGKASKIIVLDMGIKKYDFPFHYLFEVMTECNLPEMKNRDEVVIYFSSKIKDSRILQWILKNIYRNDVGRFAWKANISAIKNNITEIQKEISIDEKAGIPVLFIAAENSDYIAEPDMDAIKKIFPHSSYIEIRGSSHWIQADKPEALLNIILEYLKE